MLGEHRLGGRGRPRGRRGSPLGRCLRDARPASNSRWSWVDPTADSPSADRCLHARAAV